MDRKTYREAFDSLSFSPDFQQRTVDLLRQRARELEKEPKTMKFNLIRRPAAMAAAAALLAVSVSAAAVTLWLSPAQVAGHLDEPTLAQAFESGDAIQLDEYVETGDFAVTLLGLVSGSGLNRFEPEADASRTYAVVMLNRLDGTPLETETFDLVRYTLTPLVSGYSPSAVNNWTLDAAVSGFAQDGAYYYLLDTQSLEIFAHRTVYLAFYEGPAPSREIFQVAQDGSISFNPEYQGPQALFTLPLDPAKADPEAADAFVASTGLDLDYSAPAEEALSSQGGAPDSQRPTIYSGQDTDWMTPEELRAYIGQYLEGLQARDGLSQEDYDLAVQEGEEALSRLDELLEAAQAQDSGLTLLCRIGENGLQISGI